MSHEEKIQQILITQERMEGKIDRIASDVESEKEVRKRRNDDMDRKNDERDKRLMKLENWQSNINGRLFVTVAVGGLLWSFLTAIAIKYLFNKN